MNIESVAKEILSIIENKQKELSLNFIEDSHVYYMRGEDGLIHDDFPSVSKVLKNFYVPFPADEIAEKKSQGDIVEKERLLTEWAATADYAINLGSRTHYILENSTLRFFNREKEVRKPFFMCDETQTLKSDSMVLGGEKFLREMKKRNAVLLDTEMVLGHPELGYTGQPDKVWLFENKGNLGLCITDWKTNKEKNFKENIFTGKLLPPFSDYPDTALTHYYLQLPLYGKLLIKMLEGSKYENLPLFGCIVVLLLDSGNYREYRVPMDLIHRVLNLNVLNYIKK